MVGRLECSPIRKGSEDHGSDGTVVTTLDRTPSAVRVEHRRRLAQPEGSSEPPLPPAEGPHRLTRYGHQRLRTHALRRKEVILKAMTQLLAVLIFPSSELLARQFARLGYQVVFWPGDDDATCLEKVGNRRCLRRILGSAHFTHIGRPDPSAVHPRSCIVSSLQLLIDKGCPCSFDGVLSTKPAERQLSLRGSTVYVGSGTPLWIWLCPPLMRLQSCPGSRHLDGKVRRELAKMVRHFHIAAMTKRLEWLCKVP